MSRAALLLALLLLTGIALTASHLAPYKNKVTDSVECKACIATAFLFGRLAKIEPTEGPLLEFAKWICATFVKESWTVCDGIANQFRGEFFYVFRRLADYPSRICDAVLPGCGDPLDPLGEGWQVSLPPPMDLLNNKLEEKTGKKSSSNGEQRVMRVLQLSDIHVDMDYAPGSEAECKNPVCCRADFVTTRRSRSRISEAGYWGTVGKCDVPYRTVRHMLKHISSTQKLDYIIISGDLINHVDWKYTLDSHIKVLRNLSSLVKECFPTTPVFWAIGNHEGVPVNSFAPHTVDSVFWPTSLYEQFAEMNQPHVQDKTLNYSGSYSTLVAPKLRILSINTGFCINTNFFLYLNQSDPDGTMSWLVKELHKAELAGESVQLVGHIPPGYTDCLEGWARNYYKVIQRFSSTIVGQFFGHVHYDYFSVFYSDMNNVYSPAASVLFAAPSVTTFDYLNPAYRIYSVHPEDYRILDYETYYADLLKTSEDKEPDWKLLYSARMEFNMTDFSAASWAMVAQRLISEPALQHRFFQLSFRVRNPRCNPACRLALLCQLRSGHHNDTLYCPTSPLISNRP